ncbi:MAG: putative pit accessory protein [Pelotomaculum sp. PtaU1.Bin035]|nr:MAG: putative pit accessory protein [Pelotomaculum sp. PtaU1.Bin035]
MFQKKIDIFFDNLLMIAKNLQLAIQIFREEMDELGDAEEFALQLKTVEDMGDHYTHEIILALNRTFITPFEREDILGLTLKLDDVLDCLEACASRLELYNIIEADDYMKLFTKNIEMCIQEIVYAINHLVEKRLKDMTNHTHKINELENVADDLLRDGLKTLFSNCTDAIELIKRKDIYGMMEAVSDSCEDVANILESIMMRSS